MKTKKFFKQVKKLALGKITIEELGSGNPDVDFWDYAEILQKLSWAIKYLHNKDYEALAVVVDEIKVLINYLLTHKKEKDSAD